MANTYASNRVRSINEVLQRVMAAAGEARVGVAQEQMSQAEFERVVEYP